MKPLIVIPARGGSKGVPGKNVRLLNGKPLIHYTIDAARSVFPDDVICVSTDDPKIQSSVESTGLNVPFLRPSELATDEASMRGVLLHALMFFESNGYEADTMVVLQPTSPFRNSEHIRGAIELMDDDTDMIVSVKETRSNPYYVLFEEDAQGYLRQSKSGNYVRRQDCPKVWELNGAIYVIRVSKFKDSAFADFTRIRKFVMDDRSSIDIDTPVDWALAEIFAR